MDTSIRCQKGPEHQDPPQRHLGIRVSSLTATRAVSPHQRGPAVSVSPRRGLTWHPRRAPAARRRPWRRRPPQGGPGGERGRSGVRPGAGPAVSRGGRAGGGPCGGPSGGTCPSRSTSVPCRRRRQVPSGPGGPGPAPRPSQMAAAASRQNGAGRRLGDGARRGAGPFPRTRGGDWRRRPRRAGRLLFLYAASAFLALPGYRPLCPGPSLTLGPPAPPRLTAAPPQFAIVCDGRPARFTVEAACGVWGRGLQGARGAGGSPLPSPALRDTRPVPSPGAVPVPRRWQHAAGRELALPRGAAPALGAGQPPRHRPGGHLQLRLDP